VRWLPNGRATGSGAGLGTTVGSLVGSTLLSAGGVVASADSSVPYT
jgi:hypothetical protein